MSKDGVGARARARARARAGLVLVLVLVLALEEEEEQQQYMREEVCLAHDGGCGSCGGQLSVFGGHVTRVSRRGTQANYLAVPFPRRSPFIENGQFTGRAQFSFA